MITYTSQSIAEALSAAPARVVSLVPSVTDTLITMGLSSRIVGITDYCPIPEREPGVKRIGGTKTLDLNAIVALNPDLVIANQEENSRHEVEMLQDAGLTIWVTFPKNVDDVIFDLRLTAQFFGIYREWTPRIDTLERAYELCQFALRESSKLSYFCPIWLEKGEDRLMTFREGTYADDILRACGGSNVFGHGSNGGSSSRERGANIRSRKDEKMERYPHVTYAEIVELAPELILLPSEPYPFSPNDFEHFQRVLKGTPAVNEGNIEFIDGRLITWHGTRTAEAISKLPDLFGKMKARISDFA